VFGLNGYYLPPLGRIFWGATICIENTKDRNCLRDAMFKKRISLLKKKIILGLKKEVIVKYNHPA